MPFEAESMDPWRKSEGSPIDVPSQSRPRGKSSRRRDHRDRVVPHDRWGLLARSQRRSAGGGPLRSFTRSPLPLSIVRRGAIPGARASARDLPQHRL
jgi:hypothetical protein